MNTFENPYKEPVLIIRNNFDIQEDNDSLELIANKLNQNLKVLSNTYETIKTFTSAPLTESEYTMLQDCFNSPAMILKRGSKYEYISNQNLNFSFKKKVIEKVLEAVLKE